MTGATDALAAPPADSVVPRLVRFTGIIDPKLGPEARATEPKVLVVTFSLYRDREGGAPLWSETQAVTLDTQGHYAVLLGATQPEGLPLDLFTSGQARWLGVAPAVPGVGEKSRVLLVGVPYALKAADADTLGGMPASAFVQAGQGSGNFAAAGAPGQGPISGAPGGGTPSPGAQAREPKGKSPRPNTTIANYLPYWNGTSNVGNSAIYQSGSNLGIGTTMPGNLLDLQGGGIFRVGGSTSPGYPKAGQGFEVAFNTADGAGGGSGSGVAIFQSYSRDAKLWRDLWVRGLNTEFDADGTAAMYLASSGNMGVGTTTPAAKLEVNGTSKFDQAVTFAAGQTFPGTATLGANTFVGNQTVTGNVSASGSISGATGGFTGSSSSSILSATQTGSGSAVYGANTATSGSTVAIEGMASSSMGAGLLGRDASASTTGSQHPGYTGVWGDTGVAGNDGVLATTDDGFSVVAYNNSPTSSSNATLYVENLNTGSGLPLIRAVAGNGTNCIVASSDGNYMCNGTQSAVVPVGGRKLALYTIEAPENWFEDFGTGTLVQGLAKITLEPTFAQTVNAGMEYHVFLTPKGDCEGLYVTGETSTGFEVHELRHGRSSVAFDYRIVARRKGYEGIRLADKTKDMETPTPNLPGRRVASLPESHRAAPVSSPR